MSEPVTILLVEDSPDDIFFFKRALEKTGCRAALRVAEDGAKAIQLLSSSSDATPRVMFLDLKMPNVNGFEVLQWLARQEFKSAMRVLVLTSSDEPREMQMARSLGAADYMVKPILVDKLREELTLAVKPEPSPCSPLQAAAANS